jgi:alkylated DNA repair dioxygenase AlkB
MDANNVKVIYQTENSLIVYVKDFLPFENQEKLLRQLSKNIQWRKEVDDFGVQDRESCYMGNDPSCIFSYVGLKLTPNKWNFDCQGIRDKLNRIIAPYISKQLPQLQEKDCRVTACLMNYYRKGEGMIPWHSDEVRAHGRGKVVASVSLGGPRPFELKKRNENDEDATIMSITLDPGSVLLMAGDVQEEFLHRLPLSEENSPERISLTMRSIVPGFETTLDDSLKVK